MIENSNNTVEKMMNDVGVVVKNHFSRLIFKMNEENKCVQSTIDYIKNMPIVVKLQEELQQAREEIAQLKSQLENNNVEPIKLKMHEINEAENKTSYDEISKLVSDKVNEKEKSFAKDFMSMYLNKESDEEKGDDEDYTSVSNEKKTPIEMPYKRFLGLPKLDLDGAECSNNEEDDEEEEDEDEVEDEPEEEEAEVEEEDDVEEAEEEEAELEEDDDEEEKAEVEEEDEEEEAEEEEAEEEEDEELEVDEIEIDGKLYFTTDDKNGTLYSVDEDGDIGDEIGYLKNGKPFFS